MQIKTEAKDSIVGVFWSGLLALIIFPSIWYGSWILFHYENVAKYSAIIFVILIISDRITEVKLILSLRNFENNKEFKQSKPVDCSDTY